MTHLPKGTPPKPPQARGLLGLFFESSIPWFFAGFPCRRKHCTSTFVTADESSSLDPGHSLLHILIQISLEQEPEARCVGRVRVMSEMLKGKDRDRTISSEERSEGVVSVAVR
jgi:hypothetical protein